MSSGLGTAVGGSLLLQRICNGSVEGTELAGSRDGNGGEGGGGGFVVAGFGLTRPMIDWPERHGRLRTVTLTGACSILYDNCAAVLVG